MRRLVAAFTIAICFTGALRAEDKTDLQYLREQEAALQAADTLPSSDPARGSARMSAMQTMASALTTVGDHAAATRYFAESFYAFGNKPLPDPAAANPAHLEHVGSTLAGHIPESAIAAIVRAAKDRQIVILNESHQLSRHRAFGMQVALALRKIGFTHLAMETLDPDGDMDALAKRGYPLRLDGWYSKDPVFGDFIRQSLRAGYIPVAYEQGEDQSPKSDDWAVRIDSREESEANNLVDLVLKADPGARIFIFVGYSHVLKGSTTVDGKEQRWMAERLRAKTGIDPLSIEETEVRDPLPGSRDRALVDAIFAKTRDDIVVLASLAKPGEHYVFDRERVDMQVFHRPAKVAESGREDWLSVSGYRKPRKIPAELLPRQGRRLIQAFVEGESADAVPMDQVLVTAGEKPPMFMLPKGKYRFAWQE
jgi:hypothetical protein